MERIQEHTTPLTLEERITIATDSALSLIEAQGENYFASRDRIGYFDGESGEVHYTIEEESQLRVHLEFGVGYGNGFSSSATIEVSSKDTDPVTLGSFHEWPAKNTQLARLNETRLTDPQEIEQTVSYVEFVMDIVQADIAKRALQTARKRRNEHSKSLKDLRAFTEESKLEVDEDVYFRYSD